MRATERAIFAEELAAGPVFAGPYILRDMLQARPRLLMVAYALTLGVEAGGNVWINFIGKGRSWDLYPAAQAFWVACSIVAVIVLARTSASSVESRPSAKRLTGVVIALMFLDSFVDLCAMGGRCWWAGPPVLVEWEWDALRARGELYRCLYAYWAVTWGMQVPLRCLAIAWVLCSGGERSWNQFAFIAAGLNLIWLTAPQDVLYHFVWLGLYDAAYPYFDYLPPEGTWNLWNMLLLRVPIGVGAGSLLVWAGMGHSRGAGDSSRDGRSIGSRPAAAASSCGLIPVSRSSDPSLNENGAATSGS